MNVISRPRHDVQDIAESWLKSFGDALQAADAAGAARHFAADGHWRDVLAFTWRIESVTGVAAIEAALAPTLSRTRPRGFHIPEERSQARRVKRAGTDCIEAIFEFETAFGRANGVVRLIEEEGDWKVDELTDYEDFDQDAYVAAFTNVVAAQGQDPEAAQCLADNFAAADAGDLEQDLLSGDADAMAAYSEGC